MDEPPRLAGRLSLWVSPGITNGRSSLFGSRSRHCYAIKWVQTELEIGLEDIDSQLFCLIVSGAVKKMKTVGRSSVKKAKDVPKNFSQYLATVPIHVRKNLVKMHNAIRSTVPRDAIETISYRIPAFKTKSGVLVWFAGFSDHCSLFPTASVIDMFKDELRDFSTSKGTIHFPLDKQLPTALIKKVVKARVAQSKVKAGH